MRVRVREYACANGCACVCMCACRCVYTYLCTCTKFSLSACACLLQRLKQRVQQCPPTPCGILSYVCMCALACVCVFVCVACVCATSSVLTLTPLPTSVFLNLSLRHLNKAISCTLPLDMFTLSLPFQPHPSKTSSTNTSMRHNDVIVLQLRALSELHTPKTYSTLQTQARDIMT